MHNELLPQNDVDRLYIPRKDGGRELANAEDTVVLAEISLKNHMKECNERLSCAAREDLKIQ